MAGASRGVFLTQHDRATLVGRNRRSSGNALRLPFTRPASAPCGRKLGDQPWTTCRRRGLSDETIRKAALGYHPGPFRAPASQWGRTTWLAQGIVIPWLIEGGIWRLTIRDERVTEGNRRYLQVKGGSNGLYLAQSLLLKRQAVVLLEGEFDALSVAQECGDLVAVVATGTTKGSHTPRWVSLLAQQERVLVAFDAERDKGDADAEWWIQRLGNAQRLRPLWSDANQMLQDGVESARVGQRRPGKASGTDGKCLRIRRTTGADEGAADQSDTARVYSCLVVVCQSAGTLSICVCGR